MNGDGALNTLQGNRCCCYVKVLYCACDTHTHTLVSHTHTHTVAAQQCGKMKGLRNDKRRWFPAGPFLCSPFSFSDYLNTVITQLIDYAGAEYRGHLNNRVEEEKKNKTKLCNLQAKTQYYHRAGRRWGEKKKKRGGQWGHSSLLANCTFLFFYPPAFRVGA